MTRRRLRCKEDYAKSAKDRQLPDPITHGSQGTFRAIKMLFDFFLQIVIRRIILFGTGKRVNLFCLMVFYLIVLDSSGSKKASPSVDLGQSEFRSEHCAINATIAPL